MPIELNILGVMRYTVSNHTVEFRFNSFTNKFFPIFFRKRRFEKRYEMTKAFRFFCFFLLFFSFCLFYMHFPLAPSMIHIHIYI